MGQVRMKTFVARDERRPVTMRGFALSPSRDSDVTLADLSYGGCQIRSKDKFRPGETFELRVIKRGRMQVEVCWANDGRAGARFVS
jgi:hypothetical protein